MIDLAKVVFVHPESHSVDLVMLGDGRRVPGVKVMGPMVSSSSGVAGLVKPDAQTAPDPYNAPIRSNRDVIACVASYGPIPIVLGFLHPTVTEMLFADVDRYMNRTASDVYWTVDGLGNAELFHPSGAYIRLGTSPAHEDLTGKDVNGQFKANRSAGNAVHMHIEQAGGKASVDIDPSGAIVVSTVSTTTVNSGGAVSVHAPSALIDASSTHCTGTLLVDGQITGNGGLAISGGSGATVQGNMAVTGGNVSTDGDVKAGNISLTGHHHNDPQGGSVGAPTP